jgi:hypothetical protein
VLRLSTLKLILLITKGLIRDQHSRRMTMFVIVIAALVMLFAGATFLNSALMVHPVWFIMYWGACAWLTLVSVLLAIHDLLALRARARAERRALRAQIFGRKHRDDED